MLVTCCSVPQYWTPMQCLPTRAKCSRVCASYWLTFRHRATVDLQLGTFPAGGKNRNENEKKKASRQHCVSSASAPVFKWSRSSKTGAALRDKDHFFSFLFSTVDRSLPNVEEEEEEEDPGSLLLSPAGSFRSLDEPPRERFFFLFSFFFFFAATVK